MVNFLSNQELAQTANNQWFKPWLETHSQKKQWWKFNYDLILVYKINGDVVAFLAINNCYDSYEIIYLITHPKFRRQKIATQLMLFLLEWLSLHTRSNKLWLEVATTNQIAYQFYQQMGFQINRLRPNYYHNNIDAWEMYKKIENLFYVQS